MKAKTSKSAAARRSFLIGAGTAGAAGAAVIASNGAPLTAPAEAPQAKTHDKGGGGYHVTDHVRQYYRSTMI